MLPILDQTPANAHEASGGQEPSEQGAPARVGAKDRLREKRADVAIVGMACMFPKAGDLRRYWQNICTGVDAIGDVPPERWRVEDFYSPDRLARDQVYSRWGGFLEGVLFDPLKWRIPPASLPSIEPVQLLALEAAARAMADAGYDRREFPHEHAGVLFAAAGPHDHGTAYCFRTMLRHYLPQVEDLPAQTREHILADLESRLPEWTEDSFPGFLMNVVAGRIARELDLHGPNYTVDAACAASLAALFAAMEHLRSGTADLMLVGAVDGTNNPFCYMSFAKTHALSPRGRSRSFDETGDGIVLGEGVACLVLKRLADAERDGDRIYAVIKGIGSSSDGKNRSLTAPSPAGQARALRRAYEDAGVSPATVSLIEAHGTGTAVGDRAELTTLSEVFRPHTGDRQSVAVGSVKSMIGHTKTAAGLASLIKAALALKHRVLPPTLGIEKPNSQIDIAGSPFYLNTETRPWLEGDGAHPRRAGISAFGFGGTNFHVVLEEHKGGLHAGEVVDLSPRAAEVFLWRRSGRAELMADLRKLDGQLADATDNLAALAACLFADESRRPESDAGCRLAIVATSAEDLRRKVQKALALPPDRAEMNDPSGAYYCEAPPIQSSQICFLYPGQGSQTPNMLRDLVVGCPRGHDLFDRANRLLAGDLPQPLSRSVYPPPVFSDQDRDRQALALRDTRVAQPALGVVELFATDLLARFGVRPGMAAGHSYGEYVALFAAGCLSEEDLLRLSAARGRACADAAETPGGMAAIAASAAATRAALVELNLPATLANLNSPEQTIVAGPAAVIDAVVEQLPKKGLRARRLAVSAAFHTPLLSAAAERMAEYLETVSLQEPRLPVYSNTSGAAHGVGAQAIRERLVRHLVEPVLFEKEVRQLHADGARLFLEVGPGKILTDLVAATLRGEPVTALALDAPGREGWTQLAHLLARAAVLGVPVKLAAWFDGRGLPANTAAEFFDKARAEAKPKPTDWILTPGKAEPITPLPARKPAPKKSPTAAPAPTTEFPKQAREAGAMTTSNHEPHANGSAANGSAAHVSNGDLFAQFQATTRMMLELQQAQQRTLERFLDAQERMLLYSLNGGPGHTHSGNGSLPPSRMTPPSPPVAEAPPPPAPAPVARVRPTPVLSRPPVPVPAPVRSAPAPAAPPAPVRQPANPVVSSAGSAPPTEVFRRDLLQVVSVRTGYPIEALDETLPLEAALGIDSIKTVEIFSNLKEYHVYFRAEEQEEEELLAEFTRLKTLRDIIDSYDRRRVAPRAAAPASNGNGKSDNGNGAVERHAVLAVEAPLETNGAKKNSLRATPSSS